MLRITSRRSCKTLTALALVAVLLLLSACGSNDAADPTYNKIGTSVDSQLVKVLGELSRDSLSWDVDLPSIRLQSVTGPHFPGDKVDVFYVGANYCPACAALRWPLVITLLRFGQLDGLEYMRSSSHDVAPDTVTFSFKDVRYRSDYIALSAVERADRSGGALETMTADQLAIFHEFNAKPYTVVPGAVPFLYIGGRYLEAGSPFNATLLQHLTWKQVVAQLRNHQSAQARSILGTANLYTAALCRLTAGEPASVCSSPAIVAAGQSLPTGG